MVSANGRLVGAEREAGGDEMAAAGAVDRRFATGGEAGASHEPVKKAKMTSPNPMIWPQTHRRAGQPLSCATRWTLRSRLNHGKGIAPKAPSCTPSPISGMAMAGHPFGNLQGMPSKPGNRIRLSTPTVPNPMAWPRTYKRPDTHRGTSKMFRICVDLTVFTQI